MGTAHTRVLLGLLTFGLSVGAVSAAEPEVEVSDIQVQTSSVVIESDGSGSGVVVEVDGDPGVLEGLEVIGSEEVQTRIGEKLAERLGPEAAAKVQERMREAHLKRYDRNGDGKVTDDERDAVRQEWRDRVEQARAEARERRQLREWDKDGDGILSDSERAAMEKAEAEQAEKLCKENASIIEKYDADNDGKLSGEEVAAMKKQLEAIYEEARLIEQLATTGDRNDDLTFSPIRETSRRQQMNRFRRGMRPMMFGSRDR